MSFLQINMVNKIEEKLLLYLKRESERKNLKSSFLTKTLTKFSDGETSEVSRARSTFG